MHEEKSLVAAMVRVDLPWLSHATVEQLSIAMGRELLRRQGNLWGRDYRHDTPPAILLPRVVEDVLLALLTKVTPATPRSHYHFARVADEHYRLAYRPPGRFSPGVSEVKSRIQRALLESKPVEMTYGSADPGRIVWPIDMHSWGFSADTPAGFRNYRWERVTQVVTHLYQAEAYTPQLTIRMEGKSNYWFTCMVS